MKLADICQFLDSLAPPILAEEWDNVGLLVGDRHRNVARVMTCLTITARTADEAVQQDAHLIISHHPILFRPLTRVTTDETVGALLWKLIGQKIAIFSAHTAYDSAPRGINQQIAERLQLADIAPLLPCPQGLADGGTGRAGWCNSDGTIDELVTRIQQLFPSARCRGIRRADRRVRKVGIACGSGGSLLAAADVAGCDTLLTGEATFHTCLDAEARGLNLILIGHDASERFAMAQLAEELHVAFPSLTIWSSDTEQDPIFHW